MVNWFYYDANGKKQGPIDSATLKAFAKNGTILHETILETETGKRGKASELNGLEFAETSLPESPKVSVPMPVINTRSPSDRTNPRPQVSAQSKIVDWRHWQKGTWTIVVAAGLAILSFILPWKDMGFISINGFRLGTFLLGILFIYPVWACLSNRSLNSIAGHSCALVGIILGVVFYFQCSFELFDLKSNFAGMGVYTFIGACIILAVGIFLYHPAEIALEEQINGGETKPMPNDGFFRNPMMTAVVGFFAGMLVMFGISSLMAEYGQKTKNEKTNLNLFGSDEGDDLFSSNTAKLSPQEQIKSLEEKKAEVQKLKLLRVIDAKFYFKDDGLQMRPVIELTVKNTSEAAVSNIAFHGKLTSPDRSIPWVEEDFSYEISGGIEPNEEKTWYMAPNMFGSWGKAPQDRDDLILNAAVKSLTFADGKEIKSSTFTETDAKRLEELKKQAGKK